MATNYFFDHTNNLNSIYSLNIALETHFSGYLLNSELDRVVYSDAAHALRKRTKEKTWDESFLPFMHYKMGDIKEGSNRPLWNSSAKLRGTWIADLEKYIRFTPVTITYDSAVWYHQHLDNLFGLTEIVWDDTSETIISYYVDVKDGNGEIKQLRMFGILGFNFSYNPQYSQQDWLIENKIFTNNLNFEIQTYIIKDDVEVFMPETVVFNFAHSKGLDPTDWDTTIELMLDYSDYRSS